jgi:hypothetical protein
MFLVSYVLLSLFSTLAIASPPLVYPTSPNAPLNLHSISEQALNSTDGVLLDSLAGAIAKVDSPVVYRTGDQYYNLWLDEMVSSAGLHIDDSFSNNVTALIDRLLTIYKNNVSGMAVYSDVSDISLSHAITYCAGSLGVFAVSSASVEYFQSKYSLPIVFDARVESLALDSLNFSANIVTFQQGSAQLFLIDYAVFAGSPFLAWEDPLRKATLARLSQQSKGSAASFGWVGDEGTYVSQLSQHGVWAHASDWAKNLVTLSNVKVDVPPLPSSPEPLSVQVKANQNETAVHTVTFVLTDGDNLQWLLGSFFNSEWYGSADRPSTTMSFTLSPALLNLSSTVLSYLYRNSSPSNSFVAAPTGIGYLYPELLTDDGVLEQYVQQTLTAMKLLPNLRLLNILAGGDDISDEILLRSSSQFLADDQVDGVLYYTYGSGYAGGHGKAIWSENGKPIITARYSLWGEGTDPTTSPMLSNDGLIAALQEQVKDMTSSEGYSVIPVHAWTHTVADVKYVIDNLGPGIEVLTAEQFLQRYRDNVKR